VQRHFVATPHPSAALARLKYSQVVVPFHNPIHPGGKYDHDAVSGGVSPQPLPSIGPNAAAPSPHAADEVM